MKSVEKIQVMYYCASDGPRLTFAGNKAKNFKLLQDLFYELSRGNISDIDIKSLSFINIVGNIKIDLKNIGSIFDIPAKPYQGIKRISTFFGKKFTWCKSNEGWDYIAESICPFISEQFSGHQYLTSLEQDDVIVVISKGETSIFENNHNCYIRKVII